MSVYMRVVSLDDRIASLTKAPLIANEIDTTTLAGKERLNNLLYTRYDGDSLQILPSCSCGFITSGRRLGVICPKCNDPCVNSVERALESVLWIRAPEGLHFIVPACWEALSSVMSESGCNMLSWLCNPKYEPPGKVPMTLRRLEEAGVERGLKYFYDNFDNIMEIFFQPIGNRLIPEKHLEMQQYIRQNRDRIFCTHLPMPSKVGFVIESNTSGVYADKSMAIAIDAMHTITSVDTAITPMAQWRREAKVTTAIEKLALFYRTYVRDIISGKTGALRKHVFGGRVHFSARAVISSLACEHRYDELHIPWSLSLQLLRVHITSKLLKRDYTPVQIDYLFTTYALQYNQLLSDIMDELIAEAPHIGLPVIFQRNPSLAKGSAQLLYVTQVKKDPSINTISFSVLCLKAPNADLIARSRSFIVKAMSKNFLNRWKILVSQCATMFRKLEHECLTSH
jgi:hypothetical protein